MRLGSSLLLLGFTVSAFAQENLCELDQNSPTKRYQLDRQPSYFISADPTGRYVGVISSGNHVYDLESTGPKPKEIQVPGSYDPVFTPDGKYLTIPGATFYDADKIRNALNQGEDQITPPAVGTSAGSRASSPYQSIGILKESSQKSSYMYISDVRENNPTADLEYFIADVDHGSKKMEVARTGTLCPNMPEGNTPMVSNDGKYVSVLNTKTRSTQIYRINMDGNCPLMVDLGIPTGKVSFDFETNPRKIAFHVDRASTNITWFSGIGQGISKDTFVMDLNVNNPGAENETWSVTGVQRLGVHNEDGTGTYYPRFRKDGTLVAISWEKENRQVGDSTYPETKYYLDVYDLDRGRFTPKYDAESLATPFCEDEQLSDNTFSALALAYLWKNACDKSGLADRYRDSLLITPSMNREACEKLVESHWASKKAEFLDSPLMLDEFSGGGVHSVQKGKIKDRTSSVALAFGKDDLKSACPQEGARTPAAATVVTAVAEQVETTPEQLVMNKCGGCHDTDHAAAGLAFQDGHNINSENQGPLMGLSASTAPMAIAAMWESRMPPAGSENIRDEDRIKMTKYLLNFVEAPMRESLKQRIQQMGGSLE